MDLNSMKCKYKVRHNETTLGYELGKSQYNETLAKYFKTNKTEKNLNANMNFKSKQTRLTNLQETDTY